MEREKKDNKWIAIRSIQPPTKPQENVANFIIVEYDHGMPSEVFDTHKEVEAKSLKFFRDHSYITYMPDYFCLFLKNVTTLVSA